MVSKGPKLLDLVKRTSGIDGNFKRTLAEHLCRQYKLLSLPSNKPRNIGWVGGDRSYMLIGSLARLERALMTWSMHELVKNHGFTPVVVPNIIYNHIIDGCGFPTTTDRSQVYKISGSNRVEASIEKKQSSSQPCIAGTSEFALAALHIGDTITSEELPKRYCAMSRCYRAETSRTSSEWGLYRVHYFNKVEMFGFCMPDQSDELHDELLGIQRSLFDQLELEYKVLDMPEDDLGLSASKKYDIEAWMSGRQRYGEISSSSNCREYQASRLGIRYSRMLEQDGQLQVDTNFLHTVNGTACSSIRTILALCEQHQNQDGTVTIPKPLQPYMNGDVKFPTQKDLESLSFIQEETEAIPE